MPPVLTASMRSAPRLFDALSSSVWHCALPHRGVLALEGRDSRKFLQGLVTSDITKLDDGPQYSSFLNAKGRMIIDGFLISDTDGAVLIDVEAAALPALEQHMRRYKLRSKVSITDVSDSVAVNVVCGAGASGFEVGAPSPCEGGAWVDPRLSVLGCRILQRRAGPSPLPAGSIEAPPELHALQLAILGVPNGAADAPPEEALPLETNLELLNGVSFRKGCYLGQELTARTHFRGVVRKRLLPVISSDLMANSSSSDPTCIPALAHLPSEQERSLAARLLNRATEESSASGDTVGGVQAPPGSSLEQDSKGVAKLRSFNPLGMGIALCRLDALAGGPLVDPTGVLPELTPIRPSWWPPEIAGKESGGGEA